MKTKLTSVYYLGYTAMDRRFSTAMLPWLLREIRKMAISDKLSIAVEDGHLKAYNANFEPVIIHRLVDIIRACQVPGHPEELFYILLNEKEELLNCYLFRASTVLEVTDLFGQMREPPPPAGSPRGSSASLSAAVTRNVGFQSQNSTEHLPWNTPAMSLPKNASLNLSSDSPTPLSRSNSNASVLTSLCADLSPSESHFFEVLYIGKVRISQRKVPDTLIDDALNKFAQHEAEKAKINQLRRNSLLSSQATILSSIESMENIADKVKTDDSSNTNKKLNMTTSTTPLEPDKEMAWKSIGNIPESSAKEGSPSRLEKEFDMFTKERVERITSHQHIRKPTQTPLEPTVLILNVPKNNLSILEEDEEKSDINSVLTDTASSITVFCQNNFLKDTSPKIHAKESELSTDGVNNKNTFTMKPVNPNEKELKINGDKAQDLLEVQNEKANKSDPLIHAQINKEQETGSDNIDLTKAEQKKETVREDSPAPNLNFDEISRKPKMLMRSKSGLNSIDAKKISMPENKPFLRDRSASIGTLNLKTPIAQLIGEQNRTMLFQIGRSELRLISPDRKQILLHRAFKDVASCVLGRQNKDHFGFVCRENGCDAYACYVFKCESDSIAQEVINAIRQAFVAHAELLKKSRDKSPNLTCEHCPMLWYHRLCHDIDGMQEKKTHAFVLRRIEQLGAEEQEQIITKYQGGTNHMYEVAEHNAFLMMLLRAHCEAKQQRHVHDTAENRSEFLNQYLGGSTIFMKAKRSLSSGFDHLLKRRTSRDDTTASATIKKEVSPTVITDTVSEPSIAGGQLTPEIGSRSKSLSPAVAANGTSAEPQFPPPAIETPPIEEDPQDTKQQHNATSSPMMDIFLKVSDSRESEKSDDQKQQNDATWRQAIYQKVIQPSDTQGEELSQKDLLGLQSPEVAPGKRSKEQLRQLWRMAIDQTILLVRMEKENAKLKESEESSAVRRIKLEYLELGACDAGVSLVWDALLATRNQRVARADHHMLTQAVIQGVPRMYRGGVWYFLAEQACLRSPPPDHKRFPLYHTPYHTLLAGLTKHQHAILIDLGRTFPQHSYFASALGPGQLALYNILKAYSLLDPDVGYCQGLSFVAGTLLLHMEEAEAFTLLRHLMIRKGLRKQYLPDMSALQVQLYQLSRLLRDLEPALHARLEALEVAPALYAAPWMLTLFTSQFPLGFVVRVFDLIFLDSLDVVFAVSLALLSAHRDGLMLCESCEEAVEYLKHKLPDINKSIYDKIMKKVLALDVARRLADYAVEYGVLREERARAQRLAGDAARDRQRARRAAADRDSALDALTSYQASQSRLEGQVKVMEHQLTALSRYLTSHHKHDLPPDIRKITHTYIKKISFGAKITSFSTKFAAADDEEKAARGGASSPNLFAKVTRDELAASPNLFAKVTRDELVASPNLFAKVTRDELAAAAPRERSRASPEPDRRAQFSMSKSQSLHSGLIATNLKQYPLKVLEEGNGEPSCKSFKEMSNKKTFASTHEQIQQERMFEKQLKRDFDENLKRLDAKLTAATAGDDLDRSARRNMTLTFKTSDARTLSDSGFVTPLSPDRSDDGASVTSHPLSDCDVDIKFDGKSTKLKQIRPILKQRTSFDSVDSK